METACLARWWRRHKHWPLAALVATARPGDAVVLVGAPGRLAATGVDAGAVAGFEKSAQPGREPVVVAGQLRQRRRWCNQAVEEVEAHRRRLLAKPRHELGHRLRCA